jgi:hypothetical protein
MEHIGSAHDDVELELLKAVAKRRLAAGQGELDPGLAPVGAAGSSGDPLPITSSRMSYPPSGTCGFDSPRLFEPAGVEPTAMVIPYDRHRQRSLAERPRDPTRATGS